MTFLTDADKKKDPHGHHKKVGHKPKAHDHLIAHVVGGKRYSREPDVEDPPPCKFPAAVDEYISEHHKNKATSTIGGGGLTGLEPRR